MQKSKQAQSKQQRPQKILAANRLKISQSVPLVLL
jgi:hypothetical protein